MLHILAHAIHFLVSKKTQVKSPHAIPWTTNSPETHSVTLNCVLSLELHSMKKIQVRSHPHPHQTAHRVCQGLFNCHDPHLAAPSPKAPLSGQHAICLHLARKTRKIQGRPIPLLPVPNPLYPLLLLYSVSCGCKDDSGEAAGIWRFTWVWDTQWMPPSLDCWQEASGQGSEDVSTGCLSNVTLWKLTSAK